MYVIINGVSSDTIQGLQVLSLPPITKPKMRRQVDTIDGRAGDIITELGYEAYDRTITVLLHHNYDLDAITAFFNTSGEIIFSNEPDKKYYFRLLEKIDYERAVQFKTANITFHVQPYKYPVNETPLTVSSTAWEGTDYDQTPYIYRAVSDSSVEVGNREIVEQITGGTVAWNQHAQIRFTSNGGTLTQDGDVFTYKATAVGTVSYGNNVWISNYPSIPAGHKLFLTAQVKPSKTKNIDVHLMRTSSSGSNPSFTRTCTQGVWNTLGGILSVPTDSGATYGRMRIALNITSATGGAVGDTEQFKHVMMIDLTQMFGSTIADYIYNLEQSTAGAGVSLFKSLFPKDYYSYNSGELMSVKTSARETAGFNQWDEEWELGSIGGSGANVNATDSIRSKNYIRVIPNATYYYRTDPTYGIFTWGYDSNKNYVGRVPSTASVSNGTVMIPPNVQYIRFVVKPGYGTTYNNDICINLSKTTGSPKNGDYVPYEHHTYPLSDIELRGITKLVNNEIQYDGDIYKANGNVTRRFKVVVLDGSEAPQGLSSAYAGSFIYNSSSSAFSGVDLTKPIFCNKLVYQGMYTSNFSVGGCINANGTSFNFWVKDTAFANVNEAKTWLQSNPLTVLCELSSPTTETTTPYTETQICSPYGTESFVDDRDVQVPVGHKTKYMQINDPAELTVPNAGNVPSAPTIQLTGSGTVGVYIGNAQALQVNIPEDGITIDTEAQDATSNGQLANRSVTGDYDSVRLQPGDNDVSFSGEFSAVITNYTRWV